MAIIFLAGDKELEGANTLYITLRYYFPVKNKFTWDRKTMKVKYCNNQCPSNHRRLYRFDFEYCWDQHYNNSW